MKRDHKFIPGQMIYWSNRQSNPFRPSTSWTMYTVVSVNDDDIGCMMQASWHRKDYSIPSCTLKFGIIRSDFLDDEDMIVYDPPGLL